MRNWIKKATLGVALGAAALTAAAPADAQRYYRGNRHDSTGPAVVAGIAGLAIGAAIASNNNRGRYDRGYNGYYDRGYAYDRGYNYDRSYYDRGYPARGYYDNGYNNGYYDRGYRGCVVRRVYDPYARRAVRVRSC